jgi:hypothetical protein
MSTRPDLDPTPALVPVNIAGGMPSVCSRDEWKPTEGLGRDDDLSARGSATGSGIAMALGLVVIGCLLFLAISELLPVYVSIVSLPFLHAWLVVALLAISLLTILGALGYFLRGFLRLRANRQSLDNRIAWSQSDGVDAVRHLSRLLEEFPLEPDTATAQMFGPENAKSLRGAKDALLNRWKKDKPSEWLLKFRENFQDILDRREAGGSESWRSCENCRL